MLSTLQIENFAIIEAARIELRGGLNAITGETGAGKSIVVGALELALGGRATTDVIRAGQRLATVEAVFLPPFSDRVEDHVLRVLELEWSREEPLSVRREISTRGRSRCFIAGQLVNVGDLKSLGELLVDLHGQHEHQSLFHRAAQREALDAFGEHEDLLSAYRKDYASFTSLRRRKEELEARARDFQNRLDYLNYQIDEIEEVGPAEGEVAELMNEEARLSNAEALASAASSAYAALYEGSDEGGGSVLATLREIARSLGRIGELDIEMGHLHAREHEIEALVEDLALELRDYAGKCEANPARLEEVIGRIESVRRLQRKHNAPDEKSVVAILEELRAERERMTLDEEERGAIDAKVEAAKKKLEAKAARLSKARIKSASQLGVAVSRTLGRIAMERAEFEIQVQPSKEFGADGADVVEFLLAANVGEGKKALSDVASGGELSRTMLAIKKALAARDAIPTLIFDEIDAGISGETAARVGLLMEELGGSHQVVCITHHASIAARAGHHLSVRKFIQDKRTRMEPVRLTGEERLEELARMMGGDGQSTAGRKLAEQLLEKV
ncbi:DNA repair protein RecN [Candidatus Sumerlaeota bacterium]|nr:DNA repair protein RecN [Candidatus Sumerlaeota bacterium]